MPTVLLPTEEQDQILLVNYLDFLVNQKKIQKFTSIPNSTYTPSFNQRRKNTNMGLRRGLPDLLIITKKTALFIELKRMRRGIVSQEQQEWIDALTSVGVKAFVCRGFDEAKECVDRFI